MNYIFWSLFFAQNIDVDEFHTFLHDSQLQIPIFY